MADDRSTESRPQQRWSSSAVAASRWASPSLPLTILSRYLGPTGLRSVHPRHRLPHALQHQRPRRGDDRRAPPLDQRARPRRADGQHTHDPHHPGGRIVHPRVSAAFLIRRTRHTSKSGSGDCRALVPAHDLQRLLQRHLRREPPDGVRGARQHRAVGRRPGARCSSSCRTDGGLLRLIIAYDIGILANSLVCLYFARRFVRPHFRFDLHYIATGRARGAAARARRPRHHGVRPHRHRPAEVVHRQRDGRLLRLRLPRRRPRVPAELLFRRLRVPAAVRVSQRWRPRPLQTPLPAIARRPLARRHGHRHGHHPVRCADRADHWRRRLRRVRAKHAGAARWRRPDLDLEPRRPRPDRHWPAGCRSFRIACLGLAGEHRCQPHPDSLCTTRKELRRRPSSRRRPYLLPALIILSRYIGATPSFWVAGACCRSSASPASRCTHSTSRGRPKPCSSASCSASASPLLRIISHRRRQAAAPPRTSLAEPAITPPAIESREHLMSARSPHRDLLQRRLGRRAPLAVRVRIASRPLSRRRPLLHRPRPRSVPQLPGWHRLRRTHEHLVPFDDLPRVSGKIGKVLNAASILGRLPPLRSRPKHVAAEIDAAILRPRLRQRSATTPTRRSSCVTEDARARTTATSRCAPCTSRRCRVPTIASRQNSVPLAGCGAGRTAGYGGLRKALGCAGRAQFRCRARRTPDTRRDYACRAYGSTAP